MVLSLYLFICNYVNPLLFFTLKYFSFGFFSFSLRLLPLFMKCAIYINVPCLALPYLFLFLTIFKHMQLFMQIHSLSNMLFSASPVMYILQINLLF